MTITVASLGSVGDTAARSTYTCAISRAPAANTLVLVGVLGTAAAGTPVQPSSVSGAGLVFSLVTSSVTYNPTTPGSQLANISLWRSMGGSPSGSLISALFGVTGTGCAMLVTEVSGVSTSGTSGANAVGQSFTTSSDNTNAATVFGSSATTAGSAWFSLIGLDKSNTNNVAADNNWVSIESCAYSTPASAIWSSWTDKSGPTSVHWSMGVNSQNGGAFLVELVPDGSWVVSATTRASTLGRRFRVPDPPPGIADPLVASWMQQVARQLNSEGFISLFSGSNPNTSGFTGIPGNMLVNIGSASTNTRLWIMGGSVASVSTLSWHPLRIA